MKLTVNDAESGAVVFSLGGPGVGNIQGGADFDEVNLIGTTDASTVTITTKSGAETSVGDVVIGSADDAVVGSLKAIKADTTILRGEVTVEGTLGTATFANVQLPQALTADLTAAGTPRGTGAATADLEDADLAPVVAEALRSWTAVWAEDAEALARLAEATFAITDLPGAVLGETIGTAVLIDTDGAGCGWYVDATPGDAAEFAAAGPSVLAAPDAGHAAGRFDLLTVITHELGHVLGCADVSPSPETLMSAELDPGVRLLAVDLSAPAAVTGVTADRPPALGQTQTAWLGDYLLRGTEKDEPNRAISIVL